MYGTIKTFGGVLNWVSFGVYDASGETTNRVGAVTAGANVNRRSAGFRLGILLKVGQFCENVMIDVCIYLVMCSGSIVVSKCTLKE